MSTSMYRAMPDSLDPLAPCEQDRGLIFRPLDEESDMIRKLPSGGYRLYSRKVDPKTGKRRNLGTFETREQAEKHEREVQYFKKRG